MSERLRLFESPNPRERRAPVRIKRHSRFRPGWTVTLLGRHWSRTWAILPAGSRLDGGGYPDWLGGMSWDTRYSRARRRTGGAWGSSVNTARPIIACCRWRYR